jgi:hypothetical protein
MEAIELTYFDTCNVYRLDNVLQANGSYKQARTQIYSNVKCALSVGNRPVVNTITEGSFKTDTVLNQIHTQDKLYLNPSFLINQGDEVIVSHQGRTIKATCGLPYVYDSHQVVTVERFTYA